MAADACLRLCDVSHRRPSSGKCRLLPRPWRQDTLLLGRASTWRLEAKGDGKFVGWNVTLRQPNGKGIRSMKMRSFISTVNKSLPSNFKGWKTALALVGGFRRRAPIFRLTGYDPFLNGAATYRFFIQDAIRFEKSLRVSIDFGENEESWLVALFRKPGSELQFSSTVYWYQTEPHAALPAMPSAEERALPREGEKFPLPNRSNSAASSCSCFAGVPIEKSFMPSRATRPWLKQAVRGMLGQRRSITAGHRKRLWKSR